MSDRIIRQAGFDSRPGKMGGQLCFAGTRIPVKLVREMVAEGASPERICSYYYPDLTPEWVRAALALEDRDVSSVSPSLVEAAARAAQNAMATGTAPSQRVADAVLAAVGDALRLEGAQAERERAVEAVEVRRMDAFITENPFDYGYNQALDDVLAALGGVHPEASP